MVEYVMVPVPEEHVAEVHAFIQWSTYVVAVSWDAESIAALLERVDDLSRKLLVALAREKLDGKLCSIAEVARLAGCDPREAGGAILELNIRAVNGIVFMQPQQPVSHEGPDVWNQRIAWLRDDVAQLVIAAAVGPTDPALSERA